jgi:LPS export ABC transporter protein LptC
MYGVRHFVLLVLLVGLAGGTWWLTNFTAETEPDFDGKLRHDPDFIAMQFHSVVMAASGRPQYELRGETMRHFGDDGSSVIERPYLIQYEPGRAPTHTRADQGYVPQGSEYIRFTGNVHVAQGRDPKSAGGDIRAQQLTVKLDRSR